MSKSNNIHKRTFKGSSVPVGTKIGKVLINSKDSDKVVTAIRASLKGKAQTVKLSAATIQAIRRAKTT